jgi:hypothetical protein
MPMICKNEKVKPTTATTFRLQLKSLKTFLFKNFSYILFYGAFSLAME